MIQEMLYDATQRDEYMQYLTHHGYIIEGNDNV